VTGGILAVASVVLALVVAGCIAYFAWELTAKRNLPDGPDEPGADEGDQGPANGP
jgi:heme/copper-type cytochrome/quinol oxidase subunit 2